MNSFAENGRYWAIGVQLGGSPPAQGWIGCGAVSGHGRWIAGRAPRSWWRRSQSVGKDPRTTTQGHTFQLQMGSLDLPLTLHELSSLARGIHGASVA